MDMGNVSTSLSDTAGKQDLDICPAKAACEGQIPRITDPSCHFTQVIGGSESPGLTDLVTMPLLSSKTHTSL